MTETPPHATYRPIISAAMIMRDEAHFLHDCMRSLAGVVDEIVIADTGSTDDSVAIARSYGARVFEHPWHGDFSAARNAALDAARGDWILYIDADERLRDVDRADLDRRLSDPAMVAATVKFHPRTGFTAYPEYRLFRHADDIRYVGVIHESMMDGIRARVAAGAYIGQAGVTIRHVGYDGDQSHKFDRNETLLRRQIAADPTRAYLYWHLGTVRRDRGDLVEAEALWEEGARLSREVAGFSPRDTLCAIELLKLRLLRGEDVTAEVAQARRDYPDDLMLVWLEAKSLVAQADFAAAMAIFDRLAAIDPETLIGPVSYDARLFGGHALAEKGHCAFRLGRFAESAACYRDAALAGAAVG